MVAKDLRLDRVELRRRNLIPASDMPYRIAPITPFASSDEIDSGDYRLALDRCLDEFGWAAQAQLQGKLIGGRCPGPALGCVIAGGAPGPDEPARVAIN